MRALGWRWSSGLIVRRIALVGLIHSSRSPGGFARLRVWRVDHQRDRVDGTQKLVGSGVREVKSLANPMSSFRPDAGQGVDASPAQAVGGAFEGDNVGVVDSVVDHRGGNDLVSEDFFGTSSAFAVLTDDLDPPLHCTRDPRGLGSVTGAACGGPRRAGRVRAGQDRAMPDDGCCGQR